MQMPVKIVVATQAKRGGFVLALLALVLLLLTLHWQDVAQGPTDVFMGLNIIALIFVMGSGLVMYRMPGKTSANATQPGLTGLDTLVLFSHTKSLPEVLTSVAQAYEQNFAGLCSILLLDVTGKHLLDGSAPSLPLTYRKAIDGVAIGPNVGSCGTAAHRCETVIVDDIANDPLWQDYKGLALEHGLRACWSVPMISSQDELLGTFAIYYHEPHAPAPEELKAVEHAAYLTGLVIERHRLIRNLSDSEQRYREMFQANPHPMWVCDVETLKFLAVNDAAVTHYGYSSEEFLQMTIKDIRPAADIPGLLKRVAASSSGLDHAGLCSHCTKDGRLILVKISSHDLLFGGRPAKLVLADDVTEQQTAQAQITELNAMLEQRIEERTRELAAKSKELESFCYSVSHDLKAPLRGIDGYSRLLLEDYDEKISGEGKQFLHNIRSATTQMTELIDDLLTYSKQERRSQMLMTINLQHMVAEQLALCQSGLAKVELDVAVDAVEVVADYDGLVMALRNLIDNAIKFSGKNTSPVIRLRSQVNEHVAVLSIQDNGVGFDMRFYDRIFEIFQRLHRAEDYPGTGIGLALVRKAMDRSAGRVWAQSQPGQGATFYLELPLAAPKKDAVMSSAAVAEKPLHESAEALR